LQFYQFWAAPVALDLYFVVNLAAQDNPHFNTKKEALRLMQKHI